MIDNNKKLRIKKKVNIWWFVLNNSRGEAKYGRRLVKVLDKEFSNRIINIKENNPLAEQLAGFLSIKKFILKSEFSSFKSSLNHFTSNSHFHSNCPEKLNDSVFVIGSASITKTYSANPTGFILNRIDSILKDIEKYLDQ